jgi:biopolymer transport protein ExbD
MKPLPQEETSDLPDLTPMIDIVFLLIVFFMTVANMQVRERVPIKVPLAENAVIPEERGIRMTITIQSDGALFFGARPVVIEESGIRGKPQAQCPRRCQRSVQTSP